MTNPELWQTILGELEVTVSKANFTTWFKNTWIVERTDDDLTVAVPNTFTREWLEKKYNKLILTSLNNLYPGVRKLVYVIKSPASDREPPAPSYPATESRDPLAPLNTDLNQDYTFNSFVVGKSNEMAYVAAKSICDNQLTSAYNPLFIYGEVGLGKTHLMQAIGNEICQRRNLRLIYATAERFTNEFVEALRTKQIMTFKEKYRDNDVLLIDDIQFIAPKEQTQGEFFHTFNTLYQNNKQVVLTSDRSPRDMKALEARLRSRFEGGMLVDVSPPDEETRLAILQEKQRLSKIDLPDNVIEYIARHIKHNIRELEGAFHKIVAHIQLREDVPSVKEAAKLLETLIKEPSRQTPTTQQILKCVSEFYNISHKDIISRGRRQEIVKPRQIVMYLMRSECEASYPSIGKEIGGRDHTTAIHSYKQIYEQLRHRSELHSEIEQIIEKIYT